jgi:hypothetical protein
LDRILKMATTEDELLIAVAKMQAAIADLKDQCDGLYRKLGYPSWENEKKQRVDALLAESASRDLQTETARAAVMPESDARYERTARLASIEERLDDLELGRTRPRTKAMQAINFIIANQKALQGLIEQANRTLKEGPV